KRAYCLKTQPATGETYPKSDLFNKAALNEKAKAFYLRLGFIQLVDENSNLLFYPTKSIEQLFTDDES
ncbi:hypothetical protein VBS75_26185, partial [Klebsiella pneumoniae]|nr:hypothetical protein [Klebsiella pneumoniae]